MKVENGDFERIREHFLSTSPSDRPRPDCPAPELLWEGIQDQLPPQQLSSLLGHVAECPICTESWRLGRELGSPPVESSGSATWLKAAAGLLLVVAAAIIWLLVYQQEPIPSLRTPDQEQLVLHTETCPASSCLLQWSGIEGTVYDVTVLDEQLEVVAQAKGLTQPSFPVPADNLLALDAGSHLRVGIVARRPEQGVVAEQSSRVRLE